MHLSEPLDETAAKRRALEFLRENHNVTDTRESTVEDAGHAWHVRVLNLQRPLEGMNYRQYWFDLMIEKETAHVTVLAEELPGAIVRE